jgi:hypothetical protein
MAQLPLLPLASTVQRITLGIGFLRIRGLIQCSRHVKQTGSPEYLQLEEKRKTLFPGLERLVFG